MQFDGLPADNFERVFGPSGWQVDYVGTSPYLAIFSPRTLTFMTDMMASNPEMAARFAPMQHRLEALEPLLGNHKVHFPVWAVAATRLD